MPERRAKPRIGLTHSPDRPESYYAPYLRALEAAGAEPVLVAPGPRLSLKGLQGLLLPGGWDIDPALYGEEPEPALGKVDRRLDDLDLTALKEAVELDLPVLGICRGQQVINVALGGTLHQDVPGHDMHGLERDHLAHPVTVEAGSEFAHATGADGAPLLVNSLHHQAVKDVAPGLTVTAVSPDGLVEGLEAKAGLITAVQCHPEELVSSSPWALGLFRDFVERARRRR